MANMSLAEADQRACPEHGGRCLMIGCPSLATRDGLCSVCHVRLRPYVFQQVRQNDAIIQCESCRRILYYAPPPSATANAAATPAS